MIEFLRYLWRRFCAVSEPVRQVNHRPRYYRSGRKKAGA
jgi:hypothetical protein